MSRADGSAWPPFPADGEVRAVRAVLRPSMGEADWSATEIVVGEHVHLLAVCMCPNCRGIRDEQDFESRPQHRYFGKCNLPGCAICEGYRNDMARMAAEDERDQQHRASWKRKADAEPAA
jgi:hypothetical protein